MYSGYERIPVKRSYEDLKIVDDIPIPAKEVVFPKATGPKARERAIKVTNYSLGTKLEGPGEIITKGIISPQIEVFDGVTVHIIPLED
jgi:hypothetical protein